MQNGKPGFLVQCNNKGANAKEIHRRMAYGYCDCSPKYSTMAKWSEDSLDDPGPGRPVDVISLN